MSQQKTKLVLFAYIIWRFCHQPHPWKGAVSERRMLPWLCDEDAVGKSLLTLSCFVLFCFQLIEISSYFLVIKVFTFFHKSLTCNC